MSQILKVPKQLTSKTALETATFLNIGLNRTTKPLIEYDLVEVVNQQDVFEKERLETRNYRFSGKINIYTANELAPTERILNPDDTITVITGTLNEDWDPLLDGNPQVTPNNWLLQILYPHKKDVDFNMIYYGPNLTISSPANMGPQIETFLSATPSGEEERLGVKCVQKHNLSVYDYVYIYNREIPSNPYHGIYRVLSLGIDGENMDKNFVLDTPYTTNYTVPSNYRKIVNTTQNDINFSNTIDINTVTATDQYGGTTGTFSSNDEIYLKIETQTPHNLVIPFSVSFTPESLDPSYVPPPQVFIPPYIDLRGVGIFNGIFKVHSVIDPNTFIIKYILFTTKGQSQTYTTNKPRFRTLNGTPSDYYVRKYKVLTTNKYDSYKCAFSTSIYPTTIVNELGIANDTWLYHFNEDIDVGPLVDHNNKPLTELYLGFIKRSGQNTFPWSSVVAGWDFNSKRIIPPGLEVISNFVLGGVGTIEKPNNLSDYIGDYAEYNSSEIKERVISKIVHRFGLMSDPTGEGYFLDPFKKLEIMNFSDIIETSSINEPTGGIPNYAETYPDGGIAWRDLLGIGFIEPNSGVGVDYPFINGRHYFYGNYNFYIRRQDPQEKVINEEFIKIGEIQDVC